MLGTRAWLVAHLAADAGEALEAALVEPHRPYVVELAEVRHEPPWAADDDLRRPCLANMGDAGELVGRGDVDVYALGRSGRGHGHHEGQRGPSGATGIETEIARE
jgi:hypothetical protein